VVLKNTGELLRGQVWQSRANSLESGVIWYKYGQIFGAVDSADQISLHKSTSGIAEASVNSGGGDVSREGKNLVDDVDNTAGKVHILSYTISVFIGW